MDDLNHTRTIEGIFFMKKWNTLIFLLLTSIAFQTTHALEESDQNLGKPATVKVLLAKDTNGVLFEARGPYAVYNVENNKRQSAGKSKRFYMHPHKEGIQWGENFLGIFQLQIVPTSGDTTFLVDGVQYRGAIEVYHIDNKLNIINEVDVESFLKATLPERVTASLPSSVLDSIAIIARTDAYYHAIANAGAFWHLKAEDCNYFGNGLIHQNIDMDRSIDNTRHLVMTYDDQPFPATWTTHSGGKTANYQSIFRKQVSTPPGVEAVFAGRDRKESQWTFKIDNQELAKIAKINRVTGIDLFVDHTSNKVYGVRIHDGVHTEDIDFTTFQKYLGIHKLCSNDFTVSLKGNIATFEGFGQGSGVGLCLYSAEYMADMGEQAPQILSTFFPHTHIEKMRAYPKSIAVDHNDLLSPIKNKKAQKKKHKVLNK